MTDLLKLKLNQHFNMMNLKRQSAETGFRLANITVNHILFSYSKFDISFPILKLLLSHDP